MNFSGISDIAMDILFPSCCPVCGEVIPFEKRAGMYRPGGKDAFLPSDGGLDAHICRGCVSEFSYIIKPFCVKCGKQLRGSVGDGRRLCSDCAKKERDFVQCRCLMTYDEPAREVLVGLKYHGRRENAVILGRLAAERLGEWIRQTSADMLVPVPVHAERLRKRGYNQAELIADEIGRMLGIPVVTDILKRRKNTRALKELSIEDRLMTLNDAFEAVPCRMVPGTTLIKKGTRHKGSAEGSSGLTALIIDDIYTTGATMEICTRKLQEAGVARVYGLCAAAGLDTGDASFPVSGEGTVTRTFSM